MQAAMEGYIGLDIPVYICVVIPAIRFYCSFVCLMHFNMFDILCVPIYFICSSVRSMCVLICFCMLQGSWILDPGILDPGQMLDRGSLGPCIQGPSILGPWIFNHGSRTLVCHLHVIGMRLVRDWYVICTCLAVVCA